MQDSESNSWCWRESQGAREKKREGEERKEGGKEEEMKEERKEKWMGECLREIEEGRKKGQERKTEIENNR